MRLDRLLGRPVFGANGRRIGRLEEFRVEQQGDRWTVVEYVVGGAGLWERLSLGTRLLIGLRPHGYVVRWNQLEIDVESTRMRVTCPVEELRSL